MARSSYKVYLMSGTSEDSLSKIADIKEFPDLGNNPDNLDTTTLSDGMSTSIPDIIKVDALTFKMNYDKTEFQTIKAMEGTERFWAVCFEDEYGSDGKFSFKGYPSIVTNGAGVSAVIDMSLTVTVSSVIEFSIGTAPVVGS